MGTRIGRAWLLLCAALAVHVVDEAATGFLAVYNPTATAIRQRAPWLPFPVFTFETWLGGLVAAIVILSLLSVFVFRGARWTRPAGYAFAVLMIFNALTHTLGTLLGTNGAVRIPRPMPGFYSSPLLLAASIYLLVCLRRPRRPAAAVV